MKTVSFEKLSKKEQKRINGEKRNNWTINPVTRISADKTKYNRAKIKSERWC